MVAMQPSGAKISTMKNGSYNIGLLTSMQPYIADLAAGVN